MLFELRQYRMRPGQRENWLRFMAEEIVPYAAECRRQHSLPGSAGAVVGSWVGEQDPDLYVWIRRFDDEAERTRIYAAINQSDRWQTYFLPRIDEMIDRDQNVVTRLTPTPRSVIR